MNTVSFVYNWDSNSTIQQLIFSLLLFDALRTMIECIQFLFPLLIYLQLKYTNTINTHTYSMIEHQNSFLLLIHNIPVRFLHVDNLYKIMNEIYCTGLRGNTGFEFRKPSWHFT